MPQRRTTRDNLKREMPRAVVYSRTKPSSDERRIIDKYISGIIKRPDRGSDFERSTRLVRWLPAPLLTGMLRLSGRDMLVLMHEGDVVGHVAFHKHGDALHVFSVKVKEGHEGRGFARYGIEEFLRYAKDQKGIKKVRLGRGGHKAIEYIHRTLGEPEKKEKFGIKKIGDTGWIYFDGS